MRSSLTFLTFVLLTTVTWGVYGPLLHVGQTEMGDNGQPAAWRPFICVGLAYFLIAVVYPGFVLLTKGESGNWSLGGLFWSSIAGAIGAVGALAIIFAFKYGGDPLYVIVAAAP